MEETLGKRIAANRRRLKLTQDQLAEQLGVTAQAVSKWENDLSCPDIGILPRLASIFGSSVDALLGCERKETNMVHEAEVIPKEPEQDGLHIRNGQWDFLYSSGKKSAVGFAVWVLFCGSAMLASQLMELKLDFWDICWPSALLFFGLWGLFPKISVFRLGCALFGAYFLLENMHITSFRFSGKLVFPIFLLLFGLGLLADALRKPKSPQIEINKNHHGTCTTACDLGDDSFRCHTSFGDNSYLITLPRLVKGEIDVSFGDLTVDLNGCEEVAESCTLEANCSFGELKILVPRYYGIKANPSSAFGSFDCQGHPDPIPRATILLNANVSFGDIQIIYT